MNEVWIFLIILVICISIVICFYISNSTFPDSFWLERRLDKMDSKLSEIENMLENFFDEKEGNEGDT